MFYSQSNQDKWVCETLKYLKNGFFVDVGAYDGIQTSNTYVLEKDYAWNGICVEANPNVFKQLNINRISKNCNIAVSDYTGNCLFDNDKVSGTNGILVECDTLNNILIKNKCCKNIDYLSLDIEGSEFNALSSLDFSYWNIKLITVEHNLYLFGDKEKNKIFNLLNKYFVRVFEDVLCLDKNPMWYQKPYEDWYINKKIL